MSASARCKVCGKTIEADTPVVRVTEGSLGSRGGFVEARTLGVSHKACYLRRYGSSRDVLAQLRKELKRPAAKTAALRAAS